MARETILGPATRNAGAITSPVRPSTLKSVRVVNGRPLFGEADTRVRLEASLSAADLANPLNTMDLALEWSPDGIGGWVQLMKMTGWKGGVLNQSGQPAIPRCSASSTTFPTGGFLRVVAETGRRFAFGVDLEVV